MNESPFPAALVEELIKESAVPDIGLASIRELRQLVAHIEAKTGQRFIRMEMGIPGLPAPQIGIRETRRIAGDYTLSEDDLVSRKRFHDGLALGGHIVDIHSLSGTSEQYGRKVQPYQIPYRSLLPIGLENVIVTGRPVSATHEAHASLRVMGTCMALGEAAGTAAGIAARNGGLTRTVDAGELVSRLRSQGAIVDPEDIVEE